MARMKTGRLTTKTTPPQKNNGGTTNKVQWADPKNPPKASNQGEWDKYDQDYKAYKNYDSDVKSYSEKKKKYDEEMKGASGGYDYLRFGGKSNTRRLNPTELAEFNKGRDLEQEWVDIPKSYTGKVSDVNAYMGKSKKPTAPVKREQPKVPEILDKMPIAKPGKIDIKKRSIKVKPEEEKQAFVSPGKPIRRGKSPDMNLFAKGATTKGSGKRYVKQVIGSIGKTGDNSRGYNREEKLFKAKASTGAAGQDFTDLSSKEIKGIRKDYLKKDLQSARRDATLSPEQKAKQVAAAKMEVKQSRGAQRYSKKMEKGNLSYFTPGYNEGKNKNEEPIDKRGRIAEYKYSQDNATNRNTIDTKLKAIGEKAKTNASKRATTTIGGFEYNRMD